jgi:DNA-binding transcriptional LysR family regulator
MELRQLEYFVAVAEEHNFTRAAERVHVAQPAVSAQIARLEREVGHRLLDRSRRETRLTAAGHAVLPYARAALNAVADARLAIDELTQLVKGTVTLGTVTSHNVDIPTLLAGFHRAHPAVDITLSTDGSDALIDGVQSGALDAAIVSVGPDEVPSGLAVEVVTDEAIDAAVCLDDPWAGLTSNGLVPRQDSRPMSRSRPARRWLSPSWPNAGSGWRSCRSRRRARVQGCRPSKSRRNCAVDWCSRGGHRVR